MANDKIPLMTRMKEQSLKNKQSEKYCREASKMIGSRSRRLYFHGTKTCP